MTYPNTLDKIQILEIAKERLRKGWTKGALARDSNGMDLTPLAKGAVSWCLVGALECGLFEFLLDAITSKLENING